MTDLAFSDRAENRFVSMGLELEDRMGMLEGEFGLKELNSAYAFYYPLDRSLAQ
jgi:hypothetical protein